MRKVRRTWTTAEITIQELSSAIKGLRLGDVLLMFSTSGISPEIPEGKIGGKIEIRRDDNAKCVLVRRLN